MILSLFDLLRHFPLHGTRHASVNPNPESANRELELEERRSRMNFRTLLILGLLLFAAGVAIGAIYAQTINDAQIAQIVLTANQVDIEAGQVADARANNVDVKAFGKMMVMDHTAVNKQAMELAAKLKLMPQDNPTSQSLKMGGETNVTNLKTLSGAPFDKAYIAHEVEYHQAVVETLNKMLIPNTQNAELKALIIKVTPAFVAHLEKAKQIQATLAK
jgi:putative membrane protein